MSIGIGCFEASSSFLLKLSATPVAPSRCSGAHLEDCSSEMAGGNHFSLHDFHTTGAVLGFPGEQKLLRCENATNGERGNVMPDKPEAQAFCSTRGLHLEHSDQDIIGAVDSQAGEVSVRHSEYAAQDHVLPVRSRAFVAYDRHSDQEVIDHSGPVRFQGIGPTDRHVNQVVLENVEAGRLPAFITRDRHSDQGLLQSDDGMTRESMHPLVPKTIDFIGQHSGHLVKETTELLRLHSCASSDGHLECSPEGNIDEVQEEVSEAGSREDINKVSGVTTEGVTSDSETGAASNVGENGVGPYMGQLYCIKDADGGGSHLIESVEAEMERLRKEHEQLQQQHEALQSKMSCIEIDLARLQSIYMLELEKQRNAGHMMHPAAEPDSQHLQELVHNMPGSRSEMHLAMDVPDPFSQPIAQHHHEPFAQPVNSLEVQPSIPAPVTQNSQQAHRLFDGYNWRKYGELLQPGNLYPRVFYGCTNMGCIARKIEERSDDGLMKRMYEGVHNHPVPRRSARLLDTLKRRRRYRR